jgi:hypothetical protein
VIARLIDRSVGSQHGRGGTKKAPRRVRKAVLSIITGNEAGELVGEPVRVLVGELAERRSLGIVVDSIAKTGDELTLFLNPAARSRL